MRRLIVVCGLVMAVGSSALAQGVPSAFKCHFPTGRFSAPKAGAFEGESTKGMEFTIAAINADKKSAQMVGNAGTAPLFIMRGRNGLNFIEQTATGNINLTTVFAATDTKDGFYAAHSRHIGTDGSPMVSQFLGSCRGLRP